MALEVKDVFLNRRDSHKINIKVMFLYGLMIDIPKLWVGKSAKYVLKSVVK